MSPPTLRAAFVRVPGERDRIRARRRDGSEADWTFSSYGTNLPHDAVHLIVETTFALTSGFWGRVDAGADPQVINDEARRCVERRRYLGFGPDQRELLVAEALAAVHWVDDTRDPLELFDEVMQRGAEFGVEIPDATLDRVITTRELIARLRRRWRSLDGGETLELGFWPEDPEAGIPGLLA